ncbi:MAG: hypothetical protein AAF393_04455 [Pseudomonadota bacterium]
MFEVPQNASLKRIKFCERGQARLNDAISAILRVGKLSNKTLYDWNLGEPEEILELLEDALTLARIEFEKEVLNARLEKDGSKDCKVDLPADKQNGYSAYASAS